MNFGLAYRPRAIALILALAFALVGLGFAPAAMAMAVHGNSMDMISAPLSPVCPDCKGADHSKTIGVDCPAAACSGVIAVLPASVRLGAVRRSSFIPVAQSEGRGIVVPPDLGPPRDLLLI